MHVITSGSFRDPVSVLGVVCWFVSEIGFIKHCVDQHEPWCSCLSCHKSPANCHQVEPQWLPRHITWWRQALVSSCRAYVLIELIHFYVFMPPPTIHGRGIVFSGRTPGWLSINTCFTWCDISNQWRGFNETYHKYSSFEWALLKRFSGSEVRSWPDQLTYNGGHI